MKALITGMNGTVAPALAACLEAKSIASIAWDRDVVPADDAGRGKAFILAEAPDWFFHLAMGSPDWARTTAACCREKGIRYLYTSSVSVFDGTRDGPYTLDREPDASDDYGRYKAECERAVRAANPDAIIARLGWQIGFAAGSNNMVDFLCEQQDAHGHIDASSRWIPSCSFLPDTAEALHGLMSNGTPGLFQVEGNPGESFFEVASGLNRLLDREWDVRETADPVRDNRMIDKRVTVSPITERLPK